MEKNKGKVKNRKRGIPIAPIIIILAIIIVVIIVVLKLRGTNNDKEEGARGANEENTSTVEYVEEIDGVKINKSTKLNEAKDVNGLRITNIQLTSESGMTNLLADVTNNTGTKTEVKTVEITLLDEEGKELTTVTGILDELEAGETTQLNIAMTSNYINAYDFIVNVK